MPTAFSIQPSQTTRLRIWSAQETTHELLHLCNPDAIRLQEWETIRLDKRKREWLISRLLQKELIPGSVIMHLPSGKPVIENGPFISFSHSENLGGLLVSDTPCGLDIQRPDQKIMTIRKRFSHSTELLRAPEDPQSALNYFTAIWSAKEAVFKSFGDSVHFSEDMIIRPFQAHDTTLLLDYSGIHGTKSFTLHRHWLDGFCVVFTV